MDRVRVQIQFRKAIWTCPFCANEEVTDLNISGGNTYSHTCSQCNTWFNNFKEYNGCLAYTPEEYELVTEESMAELKQFRCNEWITSVKNAPARIEPTVEELQQEIDRKQGELDAQQAALDEVIAQQAEQAQEQSPS